MLTEHDISHLHDILAGEGTWFTAHLMRLIAKADAQNKAKLRLIFPEEVGAYEEYMACNGECCEPECKFGIWRDTQ